MPEDKTRVPTSMTSSSFFMTVAVIIPTYNYARYLRDALSSLFAQTRAADEIIVVDDGSADDPESVVVDFPMVRLIKQENRGLPAARNVGLQACSTTHVVFLDADDRLLPIALDAGLTHAAKFPSSALVYGGFQPILEDGTPFGPQIFKPVTGDGHMDLLRGLNPISVPAAALHRRDCIIEEGGFNETLRSCEDYDLYLRLASRYGIRSYPAIVAEYRRHGQNMSNNYMRMLREVLTVLDLHEARIAPNAAECGVLRRSRLGWRDMYAVLMIEEVRAKGVSFEAISNIVKAASVSPRTIVRLLVPASLMQLIRRARAEW